MTYRHPAVISGAVIGRGADHQVTETLELEEGYGELVRTVNGDLVSLTDPDFLKYSYSISGSGTLPPAFAGLRRGKAVTIVPGLLQCSVVPAGLNYVFPPRRPWNGAQPWAHRSDDGTPVEVTYVVQGSLRFFQTAAVLDTDVKVYWRLSFEMMIDSITHSDDVLGADVQWSLSAREI